MQNVLRDKPRFSQALRGVATELAERPARSGHVTVLVGSARHAHTAASAAIELAQELAQGAPGKVVLVEADFDRPRLAELLRCEVPFGRGFSEQIHAAIRRGPPSAWSVLDGGLGPHLLIEGRIRSPGLLWSQEFPWVIEALRQKYRFVVVTAPSQLSSVDQRALEDVCDDVLVLRDPKDGHDDVYAGSLEPKVLRTVVLQEDGSERPRRS